jgi:hypothetical protein
MKQTVFAFLTAFAVLAGCSKPDGDELNSMTNEPIQAMAVDMKTLASSQADDVKGISDTCKSRTFALVAGQHTVVGTVVVANDANFLYVTYNTIGDWDLGEVHLYVLDTEPAERLSPGLAPYKSGTLSNGTQSYTFMIPFSEDLVCGSSIWLQAHASVKTETAYGGIIVDPDQGSWYGKIPYLIECCEPPVECDMKASVVVTDVKCYGASTGKVDLTVTGGKAPFTFIWSNGAVTEDLDNVAAGTYSVDIYDADQCTASVKDIVVKQPLSGISANSIVTNISEFGSHDGAIDVTVSGGTLPYTYLWNNDAVTEDLTNLGPGTYSVTITDGNGCNTSLKEILVEEPKEVKLVAFARKTYEPMVHCFLTDPLLTQYEFTQWGWTNGALDPYETFQSRYELWTNVSGCDVSKATKVGDIYLHYYNGTATATITLLDGFTMKESRLYIGHDILPKYEGAYTVEPEHYPFVHTGLGAVGTDSFTVNGLSGSIYIIGYVVLNK